MSPYLREGLNVSSGDRESVLGCLDGCGVKSLESLEVRDDRSTEEV